MFSLIPTVLAQGDTLNFRPSGDFASLGTFTVPGIINTGFTWVLIIAAVVFFFMLVVGGIRWILSGGDKTQTEAARNQVTAALVGLVIVFSAWAIVRLIGTFFDVKILEGELKLPSVPQE